eukprot:scaffold81228_cov24-Phaeocystis_antarctica.AAC.1
MSRPSPCEWRAAAGEALCKCLVRAAPLHLTQPRIALSQHDSRDLLTPLWQVSAREGCDRHFTDGFKV